MWWWFASPVIIRKGYASDSALLADMHDRSFDRGWSEAEFEGLMQQDNIRALIGLERTPFGRLRSAGFVLYRFVDEEAEILSVAVMPEMRRRGLGRRLMEDALRELYRERVLTLHLEVDARNQAAVALYKTLEFDVIGEREGYYRQGQKKAGSALVMSRNVA